jgi:hypothetical protein
MQRYDSCVDRILCLLRKPANFGAVRSNARLSEMLERWCWTAARVECRATGDEMSGPPPLSADIPAESAQSVPGYQHLHNV